MANGWNNPDFGGFDPQMFGSGLGDVFTGMFGNSGRPYDKAMDQYKNYENKTSDLYQPYLNAGNQALGDYQNWVSGQKDPSGFINNLTNQYQESPYAHNLQKESMRSAQNMASANGLSGSTPLMQQMQQNANNISSQDMNQWLQNVLGINTQYGQGQNNLMQGGQNAVNSLAGMYNNQAQRMGEGAYNKERGESNDFWRTIGGGLGMLGGLFGL